jgi:hypothetical protein
MSAVARVLAVFVGFVALVLVLMALARQATFAIGETLHWPLSSWWVRLVDGSSWSSTAIVVLILVAVAAGLIVLGLRHASPARTRPVLVVFETERGTTSLDVPSLERAMRRSFERAVPGLRAGHIELAECQEGCRVRFAAEVPATDLIGVQERVYLAMAPQLQEMAGLRLEAVDVVARRLLLPAD